MRFLHTRKARRAKIKETVQHLSLEMNLCFGTKEVGPLRFLYGFHVTRVTTILNGQTNPNLMISKMNKYPLFGGADCRFYLQTCRLFGLSKALPFWGRFFSWQNIPSILKLPKCHIHASFHPNVLACTKSLQKMVQKIGYKL